MGRRKKYIREKIRDNEGKIVGVLILLAASLTIYFNMHSLSPYEQFPVIGGIWTNVVETYSVKPYTLILSTQYSTRFDEDLEFLGLYCNGELVPYDKKYKYRGIRYKWYNYQCNGVTSWKVRVLTIGNHYQKLQWGRYSVRFKNKAWNLSDFAELKGYTNQCLVDCFLDLELYNPTGRALDANRVLQRIKFNKLDKATKDLLDWGIKVLETEAVSYNDRVPIYDYNIGYWVDANGERTDYNYPIIVGYSDNWKTKQVQEFVDYGKSLDGLRFKPGQKYYVRIWGKKVPQLGKTGIDVIPTISGYDAKEWAWWNSNWKKRKSISICNHTGTNMVAGDVVDLNKDLSFTFDECVSNGECQSDGDDWRIVYQSGVNQFTEVKRSMEAKDGNRTWFGLVDNLSNGSCTPTTGAGSYWLYYDNSSAGTPNYYTQLRNPAIDVNYTGGDGNTTFLLLHFDSNADDSSRYQAHGAEHGTPTYVDMNFHKGVDLDPEDWITVDDDDVDFFSAGPWMCEGWFRIDGCTEPYNTLISKTEHTGNKKGFRFYLQEDTCYARMQFSNDGVNYQCDWLAPPVELKKGLYYIKIAFDGRNVLYKVDGFALEFCDTGSTQNMYDNGIDLFIGGESDWYGYTPDVASFDGAVDEFRCSTYVDLNALTNALRAAPDGYSVSIGAEEEVFIDVNFWKVEGIDLNAGLIPQYFNSEIDGNLTLTVWVNAYDASYDRNASLWYDTVQGGKQYLLYSDINLSTDPSGWNCDSNGGEQVCTVDVNIAPSVMADGNYYFTLEVKIGNDSNSMPTPVSIGIDNSAPDTNIYFHKWIDDFEKNWSDWQPQIDAGTPVSDSGTVKHGNYSIHFPVDASLDASDEAVWTNDLSQAIDLSAFVGTDYNIPVRGTIRLYVYLTTTDYLKGDEKAMHLLLGSDSNHVVYYIDKDSLVDGWNQWDINLFQPNHYEKAVDWTNINKIQFEVFEAAGNTVDFDVYVDKMIALVWLDQNWWNADANIVLQCGDSGGAGCKETNYRKDTDSSNTVNYGSWQAFDENILFEEDGNFNIQFYSEDALSQIEDTNTVAIWVDTTDPVTTISGYDTDWNQLDQNIQLSCSDATSGCYETLCSLDSGAWIRCDSNYLVTTDGNHELRYRSRDIAYNLEPYKTEYILVDKTAPQIKIISPIDGNTFFNTKVIRFDLNKIWGSDVNLESLIVDINGVYSEAFSFDDCDEYDGNYICEYEETIAFDTNQEDFNLSIYVWDDANNGPAQEVSIFTYIVEPDVNIGNVNEYYLSDDNGIDLYPSDLIDFNVEPWGQNDVNGILKITNSSGFDKSGSGVPIDVWVDLNISLPNDSNACIDVDNNRPSCLDLNSSSPALIYTDLNYGEYFYVWMWFDLNLIGVVDDFILDYRFWGEWS